MCFFYLEVFTRGSFREKLCVSLLLLNVAGVVGDLERVQVF